jgi:translation initiation factor 2 subunit 3
MDGAILVIAANEKCPQPQTREHLSALEVVGIKNVIIAQTKIDLVSEEKALENYNQIKEFIAGTVLENSPIIPVSAQHKINIDAILEAIEKLIPTPERDQDKSPLMYIARSFDINKPGAEIKNLSGGILGGAIVQGKLKIGDTVEIKPGVATEKGYLTISTEIVGLKKAGHNLEEAGPGGLLGLMTKLDPSLTKSDALVGSLVGYAGELPKVRNELKLKINLLARVVGSKELASVEPIRVNENLMINVCTTRSVGAVTSIKKNVIELKLKIPVCFEEKERVVISRQIAGRWRLIGYGILS